MTKFEYRILHNISYDISIRFFLTSKTEKNINKYPLTIKKCVLSVLATEKKIL